VGAQGYPFNDVIILYELSASILIIVCDARGRATHLTCLVPIGDVTKLGGAKFTRIIVLEHTHNYL
jgi:hypothetical protein